MGKDKFKRFQECETFECMVQPEFEEIFHKDHKLKGHWREDFFKNNNPIILELGCGRGEYTIGLGEKHPEINYIGVDIKGARMWRGAKTATENNMSNIGFVRTRIEFIDSFFAENEIDEVWITFPDPQLKKDRAKKRLTAPPFLEMYSRFLNSEGVVNLKTDSQFLHNFTKNVAKENDLDVEISNNDIYKLRDVPEELLTIQTTYEAKFLKEGLPITYIKFKLGKKKTFVFPDEEE
ncbi:MAG: tRNA (guanosine(46)-N7)-methyltransferase TrmB [Bacteroidetes bacterium]|nr:tRNA (guanosine(46)-N7)-methyltransferase TrmB [Bacteroidota bacterium]